LRNIINRPKQLKAAKSFEFFLDSEKYLADPKMDKKNVQKRKAKNTFGEKK